MSWEFYTLISNQRQRAGVNLVNDWRLVLQLQILCGAGYCMHVISLCFQTNWNFGSLTHKQYCAAALNSFSPKLIFAICNMKKKHWECALIETHSYWLHVLWLHSLKSTLTTTDAEEQLSYAVEWKQNKELTLQCRLHVQCEAVFNHCDG